MTQQAQAVAQGQWSQDPYFDYTTLLLQGDAGANGAQNNTFYDTSPNQFAITRNGNTTQGSFTPFSNQPGAWSAYFNASGIDKWATATNYSGTSLTVECFVYMTASTTNLSFIGSDLGTDNYYPWWNLGLNVSGYLACLTTTTVGGPPNTSLADTVAFPLNQWVHIAMVLDNTTGSLALYKNGTRIANATSGAAIYSITTDIQIGGLVQTSGGGFTSYFTGYISNARIVKSALYSGASINIPTAPLTAVANTNLLVNQSNRFVDNSGNNSGAGYSVTINGTRSIQAFSPFAPQYQWTSDVIGGSGYFDGTGDYLSIANNTAFDFGSGNFSIEAWVYVPNTTGSKSIATKDDVGARSWLFSVSGADAVFAIPAGTTSTSTGAVQANAWVHLYFGRSGNTMYKGVNGTVTSEAWTSTIPTTTTAVEIGRQGATYGNPFTGYISGLRILKGSAAYTANYTPTAPPTAVTNTSLLLNFTNAGIYDGTMKNCLETVGNAQISTSVVKYGSGSIKFNGSTDYLLSDYGTTTSPLEIFGTGDFTVECWVYFAVSPSSQNVIASNYQSTTVGWTLSVESNVVKFRALGDPIVVAGATSISATTWYHVAVARQGATIRVFLNGTQDGSATNSDNITTSTVQLNIGRLANGSGYLNGYIDDLRITKGVGRYTQNFIPPSVALPRQ